MNSSDDFRVNKRKQDWIKSGRWRKILLLANHLATKIDGEWKLATQLRSIVETGKITCHSQLSIGSTQVLVCPSKFILYAQCHNNINHVRFDLMKFGLFQLVELKNGEAYNGHLVSCDRWMNIILREVVCTSSVRNKTLCQLVFQKQTELPLN